MPEYKRRTIDTELDELQPQLPAIEIYGAKGVGKTMTAQRRAKSLLMLDGDIDSQRLRAENSLIRTLPAPLLVDEWQRMPQSWDLIRRAVDDGAEDGRFILTGSATAPKGVNLHSGAGRIVRFRMRPMTFEERDVCAPTISLASVIAGDRPKIEGTTTVGLAQYVHEIVTSGFPALRRKSGRALRAELDSYIDNVTNREFENLGVFVRNHRALRAWLTAYAAVTNQVASYNTIMEASTAGVANKPARVTTQTFRDTLENLWVLDPVEGWSPTRNRVNQLTRGPKHYLADPALACRLLNVDEAGLLHGFQGSAGTVLREGPLLGALFEHLVALSLKVGSQAAESQLGYMRTYKGDHEVDFIIERADGGVVAVEVKLSESIPDEDVRHILWLRKTIGDNLVDAMVINTGKHAYRRADGIAIVPLALLGA